jgi:hypothetical protein
MIQRLLPLLFSSLVLLWSPAALSYSGDPKSMSQHEKAKFQFNLFPNPTTGPASVQFNLTRPGTVSLSIHDVIGREISKQEEILQAGQHKLSFNLSGQKAGLYFVQIDSPDGKNSKRLVLR